MELYQNEYEKLKTLIAGEKGKTNGWIHHENRELEATFGLGGQVDQTRFLAVAQRLKSKGYVENPPVDYMTITIKDHNDDINIRRETLKDNTRFTIEGSANVEEYCNAEELGNLPYEVILKTAIGNPSEDNLVLEDYDMKFKVRREEERAKDDGVVRTILANWQNEKKAFRLIRRWTFEGDGCVFDLSMVRSNKRNPTGAYIFTTTFADANILNQPATYEIEVELKHKEETRDEKKAMAKLIKAVGEVLRGIQRSPVLIRKTVKKRTLDSYMNLVGSDKFRGVKPRTLEMKNFISRRLPNTPNIRDGYNVTDKADGLRVLGYCDAKGELFLIDKAMNVYRTGLLNESCRNSLVDGEWITTVKDPEDPAKQKGTQQLWLFDIYIAANKEVVDALPFYSAIKDTLTRYKKLQDWYSAWVKDGPTSLLQGLTAGSRLLVNLKHFEFAGKDDKEIFTKAAKMLTRDTEYNTDGLIFTSNATGLPAADSNFREQFKWKPAKENTIDFLVRVQKNPENPNEDLIETETRSDTGRLTRYKTLILKVGSTMNPACANPRDTILFEREIPKGGCKSDKFYRDSKSGKYVAVAFNPSEYADPKASVCKVEIQRDAETQLDYIKTEKSEEPIQDRSIVEMRYEMKNPEGWRWIPVRVRRDKTEKFERGELGGSLNADFTAEGVWNSIHNPITKGMISTGNEAPTKDELEGEGDDETVVNLNKPYFERKANREQLQSVEGLRNFHKHYIKGETLLKSALKGGNKFLLDLAVGEGADINRWISNDVGFVYGIDIDPKGILDSSRGAYAKYLNRLAENAGLPQTEQRSIPTMIFGIGDVSKNLETGKAGYNEEEANILRTVCGKIVPTNSNPAPPFVTNQGKDMLQGGADVVACMFALHYFFKDKETFQGLLDNIKQNLALNGYFVACFFDGQKVFDLLKNKKEGESVTGADRKFALWRITKRYSETTLPTDESGFGLAIQNQFISIGTEHTEYLVPYDLLQVKMAEIGCLPVMGEDLKQLGLPVSTETFEQTYKRAVSQAKKEGKEPYPMIKPVQEYSFLNRWCIFKRYSTEVVKEEEGVLKTLAKVVEEENEENKDKVAINTLGFREVAAVQTGLPTPVVGKPPKSPPKKPKNVNLAALAQGPPGAKPIESLGDAMAGIAAVTVPLPAPTEFSKDKVFYFAAQEQDTKDLKDEDGNLIYPDASRYIAPYTPFTVVDKEDPKEEVAYPSILHYLTGMQYKRATNKPQWAKDLFSREGSIHRGMLEEKLKLDAQFPNKEDSKYKDRLQALLLKEANEIASKNPIAMKKKYSTLDYDDANWPEQRDEILRSVYQIRFEKDAKLRDILSNLREAEKYLLYRPSPTVTTDLGGITKIGKRNTKNQKGTLKVEGENKLGKLLMKIAKFPGYEGKIESNEDQED
jgi:predicted NAD-dependent protein-ADP-ribosyltransferase YbiA (DUF1768 family)